MQHFIDVVTNLLVKLTLSGGYHLLQMNGIPISNLVYTKHNRFTDVVQESVDTKLVATREWESKFTRSELPNVDAFIRKAGISVGLTESREYDESHSGLYDIFRRIVAAAVEFKFAQSEESYILTTVNAFGLPPETTDAQWLTLLKHVKLPESTVEQVLLLPYQPKDNYAESRNNRNFTFGVKINLLPLYHSLAKVKIEPPISVVTEKIRANVDLFDALSLLLGLLMPTDSTQFQILKQANKIRPIVLPPSLPQFSIKFGFRQVERAQQFLIEPFHIQSFVPLEAALEFMSNPYACIKKLPKK